MVDVEKDGKKEVIAMSSAEARTKNMDAVLKFLQKAVVREEMHRQGLKWLVLDF